MDRNGPEWTQMDLNGQSLMSILVHLGPLWSISVHCSMESG